MSDGVASTSGTEGEEAPHSLFIAHEVLMLPFSKYTNMMMSYSLIVHKVALWVATFAISWQSGPIWSLLVKEFVFQMLGSLRLLGAWSRLSSLLCFSAQVNKFDTLPGLAVKYNVTV